MRRPASRRVALAISVVLGAAFALSTDAAPPTPAEALRAAETALRDRDWERAASELRALRIAHPAAPEAVEAHVLETRALLLAGRPKDAVTEALAFLEARPDDAWSGRVKGNLADAYAKLAAGDDEVRVLRARADVLAGPDHRGKVAALYVRLGDEDSGVESRAPAVPPVPGAAPPKPDFGRALDAYQRALAVGVAPADALRVRARVATVLEALGRHAEAAVAWDALVREAPSGPGADPEAWLVGRGRTRLAAGDAANAREDLAKTLATFPRGTRRVEALRLLARERFAVKGPEAEAAFDEGVAHLRRAIAEAGSAPDAFEPARELATAYAARARFAEAATEWRALLDRFPRNASVPEWKNALADALRRAGKFDEAVAEWRSLVATFPNHPLWQPAQQRIAEARFEKGRALAQAGDVDGAIAAWRLFAEETPADPRAPEALVEAGVLLRGRKDFEGAIALWRAVAGRYAQSEQATRARLLVANTLEDDLGRLEEAVAEYEALAAAGNAAESGQARERLDRLRRKHLEVRGERILGSTEPAVLRVVTRNVPSLSVRVYRLDLEDYFRRKHTVLGVESLQVEVVKPDATAEWRLDPYAPYALVQADRPVPVSGPGAYAVVVGDDDLTSTTLLLVGDVDVVTKTSAGRQVFAWVRHRGTGAPVEGARVLVTDGSSVFLAGVTGKDGVYRADTDRTATAVLALSGPHAASSQVTPGEAYAEGFSTKAFVQTDRPAYRPGQKVEWRAVLRRASGGAYASAPGAKATAILVDARGAEVERREVVASPRGRFDGSFPIDAAAPLGDWAVRLDVDGKTFSVPFRVLEYRKPEFTVAVVPEKPSYLTGEEVRAKVRLAYSFGGPVAGAPVTWEVVRVPRDFAPSAVDDYSWYFQDPDAIERAARAARTAPAAGAAVVARGEARTDARGETLVSFATSATQGDAEYVVRASAVDVTRRFVVDEGRVPVVRRDHAAVVTLDRRVLRPKQDVVATIVTVDATQAPVSRAGTATLLRVRRLPVLRGEKVGPSVPVPVHEEETEVAAQQATTDARGRVEVRFTVPGPGAYRVRWASRDARGGVVSATASLEAAGEAEDLSRDARVVAAKAAYAEGETAEVMIESPVTRVTALLTFEGEKVLSYRFVEIPGPSSIVSVPVEGLYAPNVFVAVSIPGPGRLLEAKDEIVVFRHLDVSVKPSKEVAAPGEEVSFEVTTKDASGAPVAAEVGLAVVDEALFSVAPDRTPAIRPFFFDRKRRHVVVTASSLGFATYGITRETNKDLLEGAQARSGDAEALSRNELRIAREAFSRGDFPTAARKALAAAEADPASWDARTFVSELRANPVAEKALRLLDETASAERLAREETEGASPGGAPTPAPTSPAVPSLEPGSEEAKDAGDAGTYSDMPFDKPAKNGLIGVGGGAGGATRARGGHRSLRTGGGGRNADLDAMRLELEHTADVRGRVEVLYAQVDRMKAGYLFGMADGAPVETALRRRFEDTAAWQPGVATDEQGKATVKVTLPDNLTRWRATAHGASDDSRFGEARATVTARKELILRVDAPRFLVAGDRATVPSAVHNEGGAEAAVHVTMTSQGASLAGGDGDLRVAAGGRAVHDRDVSVEAAGAVRLEAEARSATAADRVEVGLPALARGIRTIDGRSGTVSAARGDALESFLDVPDGAVPGATRLTVVLNPGVGAAILDALSYLELYPYGCLEQTVHRFLPAVWARAALRKAGHPDAARLDALDEAVRQSVARIRNLANPDGSFGWFRGGSGDAAMTAYALLGLRAAQESGVGGVDAAIEAASAALGNLLKAADDDRQALAHWALASVGRLHGESYDITFRRREDLSVPGLAWLTLAALAAGRSYDADEGVRLLVERRVEDGAATRWPGRPEDCFSGSDREATGLAVRALLLANAAPDHAERGLRWLLEHRVEGGFGSTKDTAAFVGAAAAWVATARDAGFGGTIRVLVNGAEVRAVAVRAGAGVDPKDRRFAVDPAALRPGRNALSFRLEGEGEVHWAARLEAVVAQETLAAEPHGVAVERIYLDPEVVPVEGSAELPPKPGYDVVRPSARPKVEPKSRERAATGDRVLVRLTVTAPRDLEYLLVEDPLPAGFEVLDETAGGPFDWQERRDDRQVFFLSRVKAGPVALHYAIQAVHLGSFTALPTVAYAMYAPEVHGRGAGHRFTVTERRPDDVETAGPTPDELFARAKRLLEARTWDEADQALRALRDGYALRDEIVEEVEAGLLRAALERKDAKGVVAAREALLRRNARRIPDDLDAALAIARAYADVGDARVASSLFRDVLARVFGLEAGWPETLAARGREAEGLQALGTSLAAYPVGNATASAALRRAVRFREVARPAGGTKKAGGPMLEEGADALRAFTAHFAETALAAPGAYAFVEALRTTRALDEAEAEATAFPRRHPDSPFVDDVLWFLVDVRLRRFEAAPGAEAAEPVLAAASRLASEEFRRPDGARAPSEFRFRAHHAVGRVRHVLGDLPAAVEAYRRAAPEVEDAREALAWLVEPRLDAPEVVEAPVAGAATVPFRTRNAAEVRLKVYPVDLTVLFTVRKSLDRLNRVELAGIVPAKEWTVPATGAPYAWRDLPVEIPVGADAAGAFLVVAKTGELEAATMIVKSDLRAALQRVGEKARVHVTDADGKPVRGAYVTVSDGTSVKARGLTDGRGVFEAPGAGARSVAVASVGDRYALAR